MLKSGETEIRSLYVGDTKIQKAYWGNVLVFSGKKFITVTVTGSSLSSLLSAGKLYVAGVRITGDSEKVEILSDEVEVSFELVEGVGAARSVVINGTDIGHVKEIGDLVSTTLSVQSGSEIEIAFTTYVEIYSVTVVVDPDGSGIATGAGQYKEGEQVTVRATPNNAYRFEGWKELGVRLPEGYTELEYIKSSSGQFIDTKLKPTTTTNVEIDVGIDMLPSAASAFFGCYVQSGSSYIQYKIISLSNGNLRAFYGSSSADFTTKLSTGRHKLSLDAVRKKGVYDGSEVTFTTTPSFSAHPNILLFAVNYAGAARDHFPMTLYSCRIYDNNVLVRDFVPCSNPSGEIGLYEMTEGRFYSNAGTGTFTAGPEITEALVTVSEDAEYTFVVSESRALIASFVTKLPPGYTAIEYIQSGNGQYINTGILSGDIYKVEMDVEPMTTSNGCFFGTSAKIVYQKKFSCEKSSTKVIFKLPGNYGSAEYTINKDTSNRRIKIIADYNNGRFTVDGETQEFTGGWYVLGYNMCLLYAPAANSGASVIPALNARLYSCKIYNKNDELLGDFIPCINSEGIPGVYNISVDETKYPFRYYKSGTITFIAGPAV